MANLNSINYLNLIGYIINILVAFLATPVFNLPSNETISATYQTIITPAGFTFAIWGVIFISQLIFTIAQMLPQYRSTEIIQEGVKFYYFYACISQSTWTFVFGYELFWFSVVIMFLILMSLSAIVIQQTKIRDVSIGNFWLFQFPFQIHCGWIFAAFLLNVNLMFIAYGATVLLQIFLASLSLALIVDATMYSLIRLPDSRPNYTIPSVFVWTTFGITIELLSPKELIVNTFNQSQIGSFRILAACLSAAILVGTIAYGIYYFYSGRSSTNGSPQDDNTPVNESTRLVV